MILPRFIVTALAKLSLRLQEGLAVGEFEGIRIAETKSAPAPHFVETITSALELLRLVDPYRFQRVKKRIKWIVNARLEDPIGARFHHRTFTCLIDYADQPGAEQQFLAAWYASVVVHEATLGMIVSV
jgi:hypothetical protein